MAKRKKLHDPIVTLNILAGKATLDYVDLLELNSGLDRLFKVIDMACGSSMLEDDNWNSDFGLDCTITIRDARAFKKLAKKVRALLGK